jgi:hypothetical protein
MKNITLFICSLFLVLAISCKEEVTEKPKVSYDSSKEKAEIKVDTTQIAVADLPINFEGSNYLIHPIGDIINYDIASKYDSGSSRTDYQQNFKVSNYNDYQITGYLKDLKFQEIGSDSITALATKPLMIESATYLKSVSDKSGQKIIVYVLSDTDSNKDLKVDQDDLKALYISTISGLKFTKLTSDFEELLDWSLIESKNLLYFRTVEDTNKNGKFDKKDAIHYYFANLNSKNWKVQNYKPI